MINWANIEVTKLFLSPSYLVSFIYLRAEFCFSFICNLKTTTEIYVFTVLRNHKNNSYAKLPIIINALVFCNFKAGKCKFNFDRETELWCYVNSGNSKIILVQNKLQEINSTQNVKN